MAFEGLSDKLGAAFKKLKNKGKLSEKDVRDAMREVRLALLEADVNYKVAEAGEPIEIAFDVEKIHIFDKETERTITN